jgi:hypothetical protein
LLQYAIQGYYDRIFPIFDEAISEFPDLVIYNVLHHKKFWNIDFVRNMMDNKIPLLIAPSNNSIFIVELLYEKSKDDFE